MWIIVFLKLRFFQKNVDSVVLISFVFKHCNAVTFHKKSSVRMPCSYTAFEGRAAFP